MAKLTKQQILNLTDEQFSELSLDEMMRAMKIKTQHRVSQMSPEQVSELTKLFK